MKQEELNVLKMYLSDTEIKELVIEEYRSIIREEIKSIRPESRAKDYERIIGNAIYKFLQDEVDALIGGNKTAKELIRENAINTITNRDLSFSIYRKANAWETEDGVGYKILRDAVIANRGILNEKVIALINNMDVDVIKDELRELMIEVINSKLFGDAKEES